MHHDNRCTILGTNLVVVELDGVDNYLFLHDGCG
jgi:hypothetical protein